MKNTVPLVYKKHNITLNYFFLILKINLNFLSYRFVSVSVLQRISSFQSASHSLPVILEVKPHWSPAAAEPGHNLWSVHRCTLAWQPMKRLRLSWVGTKCWPGRTVGRTGWLERGNAVWKTIFKIRVSARTLWHICGLLIGM